MTTQKALKELFPRFAAKESKLFVKPKRGTFHPSWGHHECEVVAFWPGIKLATPGLMAEVKKAAKFPGHAITDWEKPFLVVHVPRPDVSPTPAIRLMDASDVSSIRWENQ